MSNARLGVMGAMREEIHQLRLAMDVTREFTYAGNTFYEGTLHEVSIVLCQSGVGKVNSAMCTQLLVDRFGISQLIFTGVAGALHPQLHIGDIVVSTDAQYHDMDASPLGFARGVIPFAERSIFVADAALVDLAYQVSCRLYPGKVHQGRVLSGDQFIASRDMVTILHEQLGGWCTEMEGSAVAHVCDANEIPFVIIRSMSDRADGSAHVNFTEFVQVVAEHSAAIVQGICKQISKRFSNNLFVGYD